MHMHAHKMSRTRAGFVHLKSGGFKFVLEPSEPEPMRSEGARELRISVWLSQVQHTGTLALSVDRRSPSNINEARTRYTSTH